MGQLGGLFRRVCRDRIRQYGFQLKGARVRFNIRGKFLTERVLRHQNWLPMESVASYPWKCSCPG